MPTGPGTSGSGGSRTFSPTGQERVSIPHRVRRLLEALFSSIRTAAPELRTLHIDNTNPATIARHEDAAREALRAIIRHHTSGDVAAFGMETADPAVIAANNLKAQPDEVFRAIEIVNEEGGKRRDNVPELLPGLNFVCGLAGETEQTYELNEQFLVRVRDAGLLVRRVNIRQVMPFEGTPVYTNNTLGQARAAVPGVQGICPEQDRSPDAPAGLSHRHRAPRCADRSFRGSLVRAADGVVPDPCRDPAQTRRPEHRHRCGGGGLGDAVDHGIAGPG